MIEKKPIYKISKKSEYLDKLPEFYKEKIEEVGSVLEDKEEIYVYRVDNTFFKKDFVDAHAFCEYTENLDDEEPSYLYAKDYGVVIYKNIDLEPSNIWIDTQSLYFCTKIVVLEEGKYADCHFPIGEEQHKAIAESRALGNFFEVLKTQGFSINTSNIYIICGNKVQTTKSKSEIYANIETNVSKEFAKYFASLVSKELGNKNIQIIDMLPNQSFCITEKAPLQLTPIHSNVLVELNKLDNSMRE